MTLFGWLILGTILTALAFYLFPKLRYRFRDAKQLIDEQLSDPVKDHGHRIDDAKAKVAEAKEQMAEAIVANKQLAQKHEAALRDVSKYFRLAETAAKAQDTEAVEKFIQEKQRAEARAKSCLTQIDANDHVIETVKKQLEERSNQIENAEANKEILEVQLTGTKLRQDMAKTGSGLSEDDLGDLGKLQSHVNDELARAEAYEEVYGHTDQELEDKYANEGETVNEEALALLEKFKK